MERKEAQSIGDVLRLTIQECNMSAKLNEQKAIQFWAPYVGENIAGQCGRPFVRNGVMQIRVPSPTLRHDLTMSRSRLIDHINSKLGMEVITEIRFIS